ncbi:actinodin3 [Engraulis encrasicolus]|uniref:actinodin3 n=1 Tax=Engraulis encrasicolus TaxID=184585 RepID=UPI002FD5E381
MSAHGFCTGVLLSLVLLPVLLEATSLSKVISRRAVDGLNIDSVKAHSFLANSRPKRSPPPDPKWYRKTPDFQSYYRYYNSIGHYEGLYEVDKIRILYQQMRHLEQEYGPEAYKYQSRLGVAPTTAAPTTTTTTPAPTTTIPPPTLPPYSQAPVMYLCNPKDPLCKANIVYMPSGAVPILCDPRHHPACKPTVVEGPLEAAIPAAPVAPKVPEVPEESEEEEAEVPVAVPQHSDAPQAPPALIFKGMEYDCDPYWDPDCLIDNPPRPIVEKAPEVVPPPAAPAATEAPPAPPAPPTPAAPKEEEVKEEEEEEEVVEEAEAPAGDLTDADAESYFDPYDYRSELFNPYLYSEEDTTGPEPEDSQAAA